MADWQAGNDEIQAIRQVFEDHQAMIEAAAAGLPRVIATAGQAIVDCYRASGKVLIFGNGGSFSDALHLEGELTNRFRRDRTGLPAICLGAGQATLTATANDYSYEDLFARLVRALGQADDVAIGLSTSGESENVVRALATARELGLTTIAFTGAVGGRAAEQADILIGAPSRETARIQELHILAIHSICQQVEDALFPPTVNDATA